VTPEERCAADGGCVDCERALVTGRGSRARYRRAVEDAALDYEGEVDAACRSLRRLAAVGPLFAVDAAKVRELETTARVCTNAARRARRILERLGER